MSIARLTAAAHILALTGAVQAQELPLAPLSNYGKVVVTAKQSAGGYVAFEQAFGGSFDAEPASGYPKNSELRRLGRAVGRLDVAFARGVGYCTAFLISDQYLMTNAHCLEGGQVQAISFITGYVESGVEDGTKTYTVGTTPVEISPSRDLDFAILQVFGNPSAEWGRLTLAALEIDDTRDAGMPLMVLGHPVFQVAPVPVPQALYVSRKECRATATKPRAGKKLRHTCDTLVGNSGSPVLSDDSRQVIALHHAGDPREGVNFAIPMTLIAQRSEVVAGLLAVEPKPSNPAVAAQLAAAQAELEEMAALRSELEKLRAERDAAGVAAKATADRLAKEMAEREAADRNAALTAKRLLDEKRKAEAERDRLAEAERKKAADAARLKQAGDLRTVQTTLPDSEQYSGAYWEKTVKVLTGHDRFVSTARFSPDGTRVLTASSDGIATLWHVSGKGWPMSLKGHRGSLTSATFSTDGTRVVTGATDGTAMVWDAKNGHRLTILAGHGKGVTFAAFSPDGTLIVTTSYDGKAIVWDAGNWRRRFNLADHKDEVTGAVFSPDGTRLVTTSRDKTAVIWDTRSGRSLATLALHGGLVKHAAFSPDGTRIVTASYDDTAMIWDAKDGRHLATLKGHGDGVAHAVFSSDGTRIVTASWDDTAAIWDVRSGRRLVTLGGHTENVTHAAFSPDGTRVVTTSNDNSAAVWDARSGKRLAALTGHSGDLRFAEFSPDGSHVVTASGDKTARIWGSH